MYLFLSITIKNKKKETRIFQFNALLTNGIVLYEIVCVLSWPVAKLLDEIRGSVSSVAVIFSFFRADSILRQFHLLFSLESSLLRVDISNCRR